MERRIKPGNAVNIGKTNVILNYNMKRGGKLKLIKKQVNIVLCENFENIRGKFFFSWRVETCETTSYILNKLAAKTGRL